MLVAVVAKQHAPLRSLLLSSHSLHGLSGTAEPMSKKLAFLID